MKAKGSSGEVSELNEKCDFQNAFQKAFFFYKLTENLVELCSIVRWKVEVVGDKCRYLDWGFTSNVWKAQPGYSLLLIVKYKRKENKKETIKHIGTRN